MSRALHQFREVENRIDRGATKERRERTRALLVDTAKSIVNAALGDRSEEEVDALAWLLIDEVVDRLADPIATAAGLAARIQRIAPAITVKTRSSAKTAADRLFSAKEPV